MKKRFALIIVIVGVAIACSTQKNVTSDRCGRLGIKDSTQYELIIFDTGFDSWLAINKNRIPTYSNEYYQTANNFFAMEWNRRYGAGDRRVQSYIDYSMSVDYGYDFNYKLYMYFKFWEDSNRTKLAPGF